MIHDADDAACCTEIVLHTAAWLAEKEPETVGDNLTVLRFLRADGGTELAAVATLQRVAEIIADLAPPCVRIQSADNEDVTDLALLVRLATVGGPCH